MTAENMSEAFLIGNGKVERLIGQRGETPPCPQARFAKGDVVKVPRRQHLAHIPEELVVLVAIPPGFSPDHALADLMGEPRPLMCQVPYRAITYILCREGDTKPYCLKERDMKPSGKDRVEIGSVRSTHAVSP